MQNEKRELRNSDRDAISARYEDLREGVITNGRLQGEGIIVFLRQGMIGWIEAWLNWVPPVHTIKEKDYCQFSEPNLSIDLRRQMTVALSNMVMNRWEVNCV